MSTINFDEEYRKLSLDSIGPINNLSNRIRKNIKFAMLKNIWPMQTMVKFKMRQGKNKENRENYENLKKYLRKNSSFASFWLERWPQKEIYLNFLNFDKFKECLSQNLSTRATFEDNEQLFVFEGGDVSEYDDETLKLVEKLILHIDTQGKFLIAEMANYNLLAHCSTTKKSTEITSAHLGAILNYIKQGVLDVISTIDLKCAIGSEEYLDLIARISDTFNLLANTCKTNIAKYQAQNYDAMMKMNDERFFKEYTNLLSLQRASEKQQIKDIQEDYQEAKKEVSRFGPEYVQKYSRRMSTLVKGRVATRERIIDARIHKLKAQINKAKEEGLEQDVNLLANSSLSFRNSAWYVKKITQIRYLEQDIPFKIMRYGYKIARKTYKVGKKTTGSRTAGMATVLASYYGLDMMLGAAFGIGISPLILGSVGIAFATGYIGKKALEQRADFLRSKGLKESLPIQQQALLVYQRRYFFVKSSLDYLILCGYRTDGMESLAKYEKSLEDKIKKIEKDTKELEVMESSTSNIIQKSIADNYKYTQDTVYGSYEYAQDTVSQGYNYLTKCIWG